METYVEKIGKTLEGSLRRTKAEEVMVQAQLEARERTALVLLSLVRERLPAYQVQIAVSSAIFIMDRRDDEPVDNDGLWDWALEQADDLLGGALGGTE